MTCTSRFRQIPDVAEPVPVRVHEPLSVLDALEINRSLHSWSLDAGPAPHPDRRIGVAVLLNWVARAAPSCSLRSSSDGGAAGSRPLSAAFAWDLRTCCMWAQILRDCGVHKMRLMGNPRRMPSMAGYGLETTGYITCKDYPGTHHMFGADKGALLAAGDAGSTAGRSSTSASSRPAQRTHHQCPPPAAASRVPVLGVPDKHVDHVCSSARLKCPWPFRRWPRRISTTR